jgi:hypothetical protein
VNNKSRDKDDASLFDQGKPRDHSDPIKSHDANELENMDQHYGSHDSDGGSKLILKYDPSDDIHNEKDTDGKGEAKANDDYQNQFADDDFIDDEDDENYSYDGGYDADTILHLLGGKSENAKKKRHKLIEKMRNWLPKAIPLS